MQKLPVTSLFLTLCCIFGSTASLALESDCLGRLCFSSVDVESPELPPALLDHRPKRQNADGEFSSCFLDEDRQLSWTISAFDFHRRSKRLSVLNVSVAFVSCPQGRGRSRSYYWGHPSTSKGIRLGSTRPDVLRKYGLADREIDATAAHSKSYVRGFLGNAEFHSLWIYFGPDNSLQRTIFVFDERGAVIGISVGLSRG